MNDDFLLKTDLSKALYEEVRDLPIIDFHNHLSVSDVANDRQFQNITELWIESDPYKLRAMRILGVPERLLTGDGDPEEKWNAYVEYLPLLVGNPLYDWSHLEMERVFGLTDGLNPAKKSETYQLLKEKLQTPEFSAQGILKKFKVEYSAPCAAFGDDFPELPGMAPSLRTDSLFSDPKGVGEKLTGKYGRSIRTAADYYEALAEDIGAMKKRNLVFLDISLDSGWHYQKESGREEEVLQKVLSGDTVTEEERAVLNAAFLRALYGIAREKDMVVQLHMGAARFTSDRLRRVAGPAGGFAGIGRVDTASVIELLRDLENRGILVQTILYTLNPNDYEELAILSGSFNEAGTPGFVQLGPAWWWCDHIAGMKGALNAISNYSVLSTFIGMTTDSRSLLSMSRHEYFRRVLCAYLGEKAAAGELPDSMEVLAPIARKICYENAKDILRKRGIGNE